MAKCGWVPEPPSEWLRHAGIARSITTERAAAIRIVGSLTREATIEPTLVGGRAWPEVAYAWEA
jgi:hypothetical protein